MCANLIFLPFCFQGSSILFDLLLHQHDPLSSPDTASSENKVKESTPEISAVENMEVSCTNVRTYIHTFNPLYIVCIAFIF